METTPLTGNEALNMGLHSLSGFELAQSQWQRFRFYCDNGHSAYVAKYRRNQRYFDGDGGQWADDDRTYMESIQGRKCFEINLSKQSVLTAVGEQISTRTDVTYKPKKGKASAQTAKDMSKVGMHILTENDYHSKETDVWMSGLISDRGYFDVRMNYDGNTNGEIKIVDVDATTVIPDIFATSYDPKEWPGFLRFMWLSLDEIEGMYGPEARQKAEKDYGIFCDRPFAEEFSQVNASDGTYGFGSTNGYYQWWDKETGELRLRVIERQYYEYSMCLHYIDPSTGDKEMVPPGMKDAEARAFADANGLLVMKLRGQRIKWCVTTATSVLFNEINPYQTYTIIPFFYIFNKGKTGSMMSDAISPQDLLNKSVSATVHYLTSLSNSGWIAQNGKLVNITPKELEKVGMKTGLVVVVDGPIGDCLQKIQANRFPDGMDRMAEHGEAWIKAATGMSDAEQGLDSPEVSGIALGMKTFQSKLQLALSLSNLELTRKLVGRKVIELVQQYYTNERVFKITGKDDYGRETEEEIALNQADMFGNILNDVTLGEYEIAVSTQPTAATYEESQFKQLGMMRKDMNVAIPDDEVIRRSNLANKHELADRMSNPQDGGVAAAQAQMLERQIADMEAATELKKAQRTKVIAEATNTNIQAMFGAVNAGKVISMIPAVASLADELMLSGGFEDHNAPPVVPQNIPRIPGIGDDLGITPNTSPNFPPQADSGAMAGVEGGGMA